MLDEGAASRNLQQLRDAGFRIALDDFGTGYSSLSYLRQLAVDKIKIDRSFVADLQHSRDARAIVAAIVTLGRAIGLTVSAEGVETVAQMEILLAAGCDQLQGFLFGTPQATLSYEQPRLAAS
jgi:EAL domain-containing protein (putative c-di-GMP-specific phosphodiesterase class I)